MPKKQLRYVLWKAVVDLLCLTMLLGATVPLYYILSKNLSNEATASTVASCVSFFFFPMLYFYFLRRSDLRKMKTGQFFAGEIAAYALLCAAAHLLLFLISGARKPAAFSYLSFLFLPMYGAAYLTSDLLIGAAIQIAAFALILPLLYGVKKKVDPTLSGGKGKVPPTSRGSVFEGSAEEKEPGEDGGNGGNGGNEGNGGNGCEGSAAKRMEKEERR